MACTILVLATAVALIIVDLVSAFPSLCDIANAFALPCVEAFSIGTTTGGTIVGALKPREAGTLVEALASVAVCVIDGVLNPGT